MRILAVCGGNGSWLYPLKSELVGNIEPRVLFYTLNNEQWEANFLPIVMCKSLNIYRWENIDVIIGAPNCGHSSMMALTNSTFREAKEDESFRYFFEGVKMYNPKIFVMENLPKSANNAKELAEQLGYTFVEHNISMGELGNSQLNRKRYILVGINKSLPEKTQERIAKIMSRIKKMVKHKSCGELLEGLDNDGNGENIPELGHVRESLSDMVTIYAGRKITLEEARQYWVKNKHAKRFTAIDRKYDTAPGVYRNLKDGYPAVARKADRQFNHHGYQMTPRELARIQGIPDSFEIYFPRDLSNPKIRNYWINKGRITVTKCPPYELGLWLKNRLSKIEAKGLI